MKSFRDIRVIPVVLVAIFGLVVLKIAGLVIDGGYVFDYRPASTGPSWAQENLNFPGGKTDASDVTGSVEKPKEAEPAVAAPATKPEGVVIRPEENPPVSASEARAREIDIRESLLKAAEKRIESRVEEMKAVESRMSTSSEQKAEADTARFKGIVTMYEAMKPKDAARVFDRLEMSVLIEIASQIAPRKMSDILGLMQSDAAERLTVELARRAGGDKSATAADLPKIEGKMLSQKPN